MSWRNSGATVCSRFPIRLLIWCALTCVISNGTRFDGRAIATLPASFPRLNTASASIACGASTQCLRCRRGSGSRLRVGRRIAPPTHHGGRGGLEVKIPNKNRIFPQCPPFPSWWRVHSATLSEHQRPPSGTDTPAAMRTPTGRYSSMTAWASKRTARCVATWRCTPPPMRPIRGGYTYE